MSKDAMITMLGVWVAVLPFLGFPGKWRTALLFLTGLLIVGLGLKLRRELLLTGMWPMMRRRTSETYSQNDIRSPLSDAHDKTEAKA